MKWPAASPEEEELPSLTHSLQSSDRSSNQSPSLSDDILDDGLYSAQETKQGRRPRRRSSASGGADRSARSGRSARSARDADRPSRAAKSPPPPPPRSRRRGNRSKADNLRFSQTSRTSLDGTTIYQTAPMAALDKHLRTASGLRLQLDGTCSFVFEEQTFVIEAVNEHNGDYIFYTGLGSARRLQRLKGWRPQYLLRLLAQWNEELKDRRADDEKAGVLRIDSSKPEGAQVAFIYYGNVNEVKSSSHFQEALDDFVDDALHFSEKLHGAVGFEDGEEVQDEDESRATWEESHSKSSHSFGKSNSSLHASSHSINASSHSFHKSNHSLNASQSFHKSTASLNTRSVTSSDIFHATANSKKSVLSKMMESFRPKSSADIGAVAFVDPNSSACAFVVDKPSIVLQRAGDRPQAYQEKKGSSFRDDGNLSFHSSSRSFNRSRRHSAEEPDGASDRSFRGSRRHSAEDHGASTKSIDIYDEWSRRTHRTACSDRHRKGGGRHRHSHRHNNSRKMNMSEPILRSGP